MKINTILFFLSLTFCCLSATAQKTGSTPSVNPLPAKQIKTKGVLNNKTGLDACSWVIKLNARDNNDHEFLEPLNLNKFKIKLVEGKKVEIVYVEENATGACMIGTIVMLKSIKAIK